MWSRLTAIAAGWKKVNRLYRVDRTHLLLMNRRASTTNKFVGQFIIRSNLTLAIGLEESGLEKNHFHKLKFPRFLDNLYRQRCSNFPLNT